MIVCIVGGGASGMAAAISAAQDRKNQVVLLERQVRVGRKLLATGNGRCNLTNLQANFPHYHGETPHFADYALQRFSAENTLEWFRDLGLYTVAEPSGRVYPYSDQAHSVLDVLRFALNRDNIQVKTGFEVTKVRRMDGGFRIYGDSESIFCDKLIIACGGLAGTKLGGTMSGYRILRSLGHHCTKLRPNLVQIKSDWSGCNALKGVRANCAVSVYQNGTLANVSEGELQFTQYGLSGPVIFEVCRDVCTEGVWTAVLNFAPMFSHDELLSALHSQAKRFVSAEDLLSGMLHNRLGRVLIQCAGISGQRPANTLSEEELESVAILIQRLEVSLLDTMGMENAQVTAGGIFTSEFYSETMESRLVPGLYACGEVLDIDGDCGGYNLQWAWSSGRLAGEKAGEIL